MASTTAVAAAFGVGHAQAERDRMISFILATISEHWADQLTFIGGTALARTDLPDGRLSEDIDLITHTPRSTIAQQMDRVLPDAFRRELGRLHWDPALSAVGDAGEAFLHTDDGLSVKIQLISHIGHPNWPTQRTQLEQRYDDTPPAALDVLTTPAFVAAKTAAWHDRRAPRDLWDLWALNARGAIDSDAAELFRKLGPTARKPDPAWFTTAPSESDWNDSLASQTILTITAAEAAHEVHDAWNSLRHN